MLPLLYDSLKEKSSVFWGSVVTIVEGFNQNHMPQLIKSSLDDRRYDDIYTSLDDILSAWPVNSILSI